MDDFVSTGYFGFGDMWFELEDQHAAECPSWYDLAVDYFLAGGSLDGEAGSIIVFAEPLVDFARDRV